MLVRVVDGRIVPGMRIRLAATGGEYQVLSVGTMALKMVPAESLGVGEVGYVLGGIRNVQDTRIGDTIVEADRPPAEILPGYKDVKPMVFAGLYPIDSSQYEDLRDALEKLRLNDASFSYEPESSLALGFGFRCGFLGLLHMEIIQERLEREFRLSLISTAPTVVYRVHLTDGETVSVDNPTMVPDRGRIDSIEEPFIRAVIITPEEYVGAILALCQERRGAQTDLKYIGPDRVMVTYEIPLNEVVLDFYDRLKSATRGYASFDYDLIGYKASDLVKLDVLLNGETVDALSVIVHREKALAAAVSSRRR